MKTPIVVWIDAEPERCGECNCHADAEYDYDTAWCAWMERRGAEQERFRGPRCIQAERKLAALVEAGEEMTHDMSRPDASQVWGRAIAAIKGGE